MKSSVFSRDLKDVSEMLGCFSSGAKEFQNFCLDGDSKTTKTHLHSSSPGNSQITMSS